MELSSQATDQNNLDWLYKVKEDVLSKQMTLLHLGGFWSLLMAVGRAKLTSDDVLCCGWNFLSKRSSPVGRNN